MWRTGISTLVALTLFSSVAAAQQPCTTDARRVVDELYRHMLERGADPASNEKAQRLQNGQATVRDIVREIATSPEHTQRFFQRENGEAITYERAVGRMYQHMLARQADPAGQRTGAELAQRNDVAAVVNWLAESGEYMNNFGDYGVPGSGGLRFCATGGQSSSAPAAAPQQADRNMSQRFRRMDTDANGSISNREWQGTRESFRVQDWNNDGVLSGDEVRRGGGGAARTRTDDAFNRQQRFETLDANNNNRVDFNEWQGTVDAFDRLDVNADGILNRAEVTGGARGQGQGQPGAVATSGTGVYVDSRQRWTDSGLDVRANQTLTITADGSIGLSDNGSDLASPAGSTSNRRAAAAPFPQSSAGGLIARIGNSAPFFVGNRRSLRAPATGRLYFGVNDDHLPDNTGEFNVNVSVR